MEIVYHCSSDVKSKVQTILEQDSIAHVSFARQGYEFKDGKAYDVDGWILYIKGEPKFFEWADKQLGDYVKKLPDDKAQDIMAELKIEKDKASEAFGSLFG